MDYQFSMAALSPFIGQFLSGLWVTVELTILATLTGLTIGTMCAIGRVSANTVIKLPCSIYVELIRNTPFIVQLFFVFFGLSSLGFKLSAWQAALIAMTLNLGAYSAEIIRAGIVATPKGQWEAGQSLGLSRQQIFRHIVLSPAFQRVYPALISQCIIVMLGSAVVSQISVEDLTFAANYVQTQSFLSFESYALASLIYLALSISMRQVFMLAKHRLFKNPAL